MKHDWKMTEALDCVCRRCAVVWDGDNKNHECEVDDARDRSESADSAQHQC